MVAIFGVVGIAGDLLTRLVRNMPVLAGVVVTLVLVGVGIRLLATAKAQSRGTYWATLLLLLGLWAALWLGVLSQVFRETPKLQASAVLNAGGRSVAVSAAVSSTGLRANERLLVQVLGMPNNMPPQVMWERCAMPQEAMVGHPRASKESIPLDVTLIGWDESGADATGKADARVDVTIPTGEFERVCALGALTSRAAEGLDGALKLDAVIKQGPGRVMAFMRTPTEVAPTPATATQDGTATRAG